MKAGGTEIMVSAQVAPEPDGAGGVPLRSEALAAPATLSLEDELLLSSFLNDLEDARHYAHTAFHLFDELTDEKAKDERKRIRQELKNLRMQFTQYQTRPLLISYTLRMSVITL